MNIDDLPNWFIHEKALNIYGMEKDKVDKAIVSSDTANFQDKGETEEQIQENILNILNKYKNYSKAYSDHDYKGFEKKTKEPIADHVIKKTYM